MPLQVYRGAIGPEKFTVRVRNRSGESSPLDFITATAVEFRVLGSPTVWGASITAASSSELSATHVWAAGEIPAAGLVRLMLHITTPGGLRRAGPISLEVL